MIMSLVYIHLGPLSVYEEIMVKYYIYKQKYYICIVVIFT